MPLSSAVRAEISAVVGARQVITEPEQLRVYDCDGLTGWRAMPELVVLPGSTDEVLGVVRICAARRRAVRRARRRHRALGRCAAGRRRNRDLARADARILEIDLDTQRVVGASRASRTST